MLAVAEECGEIAIRGGVNSSGALALGFGGSSPSERFAGLVVEFGGDVVEVREHGVRPDRLADGTRVVSSPLREVTGADGRLVASNEVFSPATTAERV